MYAHETRSGDLTLRLEADDTCMRVMASRGGKVLATVSQGHSGLYGPTSCRPEATGLAKALRSEAESKALGRIRRSPFDALVDDLRAARGTKRTFGRSKPALFVNAPKRKPAKNPIPLIFTRGR